MTGSWLYYLATVIKDLKIDKSREIIKTEKKQIMTERLKRMAMVQFRVRHDFWIKAPGTHLHGVSLDLKEMLINTDGKVPQISKLNITQSYKQVIFSLEFENILLSVEANPGQMRSQCF